MRIRRHAKLAGISFSNAGVGSGDISPHLRICHLNQSPWDAISFPPDSASSPYQFDGEESFAANASFGDSLGAVESVASMKLYLDDEDEKNANEGARVEDLSVEDNAEEGEKDQLELGAAETATVCCKTDGKGWQCRQDSTRGRSLCDHHLIQLRAYNTVCHPSPAAAASKKPEKSAVVRRHRRNKKAALPSTSAAAGSNPYEFYYYSGFGPRWGKKRGAVEESHEAKGEDESQPSDSPMDSEEFDYVDDDDDEDSVDGVSPERKRTRKPIKARSLKSLM